MSVQSLDTVHLDELESDASRTGKYVVRSWRPIDFWVAEGKFLKGYCRVVIGYDYDIFMIVVICAVSFLLKHFTMIRWSFSHDHTTSAWLQKVKGFSSSYEPSDDLELFTFTAVFQ